jgi:hypothetical protein
VEGLNEAAKRALATKLLRLRRRRGGDCNALLVFAHPDWFAVSRGIRGGPRLRFADARLKASERYRWTPFGLMSSREREPSRIAIAKSRRHSDPEKQGFLQDHHRT